MRRFIFLTILLMLSTAAVAAEGLIVPRPATVSIGSGGFTLTAKTPILVPLNNLGARKTAEYLRDLLARTHGLHMSIKEALDPNVAGAIALGVSPKASAGGEGYQLDVTNQGVRILGDGEPGLFYGAITLWQLIPKTSGHATAQIPSIHVTDSPRFSWRGFMLDSARHIQSVAFIKRLLDTMALHKLNVFHWHLTDDQGWRIEIKKLPRLTKIGSWRRAISPDPAGRYGGFYSQTEIRDIVRYAQERQITVVPEVDMPAHATAAIASYPELGVAEFPVKTVASDWGVSPNIFGITETTFDKIDTVLDELLNLFPSKFIHVGGDEALKDHWRLSPSTQTAIKKLGVKNEDGLQSYFVNRVSQFIAAKARRPVFWDDVVKAGFQKNSVVMVWKEDERVAAVAKGGNDVVVAVAPTYYLNERQSNSPLEPPGWSKIITLQDIYQFEPVPAGLTESDRHHIIGVEATMFTERARTEEMVERLILPRLAALAETAWAPKEGRDWVDFSKRMVVQNERYRELGLNVAPSSEPSPAIESLPIKKFSTQLSLCGKDPDGLDVEGDWHEAGRLPIALIPVYEPPCWEYPSVDLTHVTRIRIAAARLPYNYFHPEVKFPKPRTPDGELEIRIDSKDSLPIAILPLKTVPHRKGLAILQATLPTSTGKHNLYISTTGKDLDPANADPRPLTVIDWIELQ